MQFTAINTFLKNKTPLNVVMEASGDYVTVDVDGQSMNVSLITDKMIEENNLPEVSDPVLFKKGSVPTDNGLFSPIIFGDSPREKRLNHAYINLKRKFFHPYVFETIVALNRKIDIVARGESVWDITETGELVEIKNVDDPNYNEDNTGLAWLIDHFHEIKFKETKSAENQEKNKLLKNLSDDEIFITKWIVIPVFYRDYDISSGKRSIPEINNFYTHLIQNSIALDASIISIAKHATMYKIQETLVKMRKNGQSLIEKKKGAFQTAILGKSPDFGARGVISVPSLNNCDTPNDCIVDIKHSGIPLSFCISLGYPFMMKWIQEFFEDMFRNKRTIPAFRKDKNGEFKLEYVPIIDQTDIYTEEFIKKKMEMFRRTYGAERFETIKIKCEDGSEAEVMFTGKGYATRPDDPRANTIGNRPLTWTDVFYLAAENTLSSKYCYITRYPLEDYFGTFPSQVAVLSTIKTTPVIINGKVYPHYPVIDLSLSPNEIATQFIDTISISNLYLDAIGGD